MDSNPTPSTPPSDTASRLGTPVATTPIAAAIREELFAMCKTPPFDLKKLDGIRQVATHGRNLLACRNPVAAFDARRGDANVAGGGLPPPVVVDAEGMGAYGPGGRESFMPQEIRDKQQQLLREELAKSPLVAAVRKELLELVEKEPFTPTELVEIERLAAHAMRVLMARLGLKDQAGGPCGPQVAGALGMNPTGYGSSGYFNADNSALASSPETFGAKLAREVIGAIRKAVDVVQHDPTKLVLAAAAARERGMNELADRLEAQIGGEEPTDGPSLPDSPPTAVQKAG